MFWSVFISCSPTENTIDVVVEKGLDMNLVKIQYGFYSGHNKSDKKLIEQGLHRVIFENNQSKHFNTICGENDFLITYGNKYYVKVRHFIPNDFYDGIPEKHEYNFEITKSNDELILNLKIIGVNGETITNKFSKIEDTYNDM